jgi:hypothetical protein
MAVEVRCAGGKECTGWGATGGAFVGHEQDSALAADNERASSTMAWPGIPPLLLRSSARAFPYAKCAPVSIPALGKSVNKSTLEH